jgi:hypothetical protein
VDEYQESAASRADPGQRRLAFQLELVGTKQVHPFGDLVIDLLGEQLRRERGGLVLDGVLRGVGHVPDDVDGFDDDAADQISRRRADSTNRSLAVSRQKVRTNTVGANPVVRQSAARRRQDVVPAAGRSDLFRWGVAGSNACTDHAKPSMHSVVTSSAEELFAESND